MIIWARTVGCAAACMALAVDQALKALAVEYRLILADTIEVLPVLNLAFVHNTGVTFGLLGGLPWWVLALAGSAIVVGLGVWMWRSQSIWTSSAIGLVIGGGAGNLVDRVRHGAVIDYLDFHYAGYHWPAFNAADIAVFSGVVILIIVNFGPKQKTS